MNTENFQNLNINTDSNNFAQDSLNQNNSESNKDINMQNININNILDSNMINNNNLSLLQEQNTNLQNQILILTKRIKEYEKDYIMHNDQKTKQIKEFAEIEKELNNQIKQKNEIINKLQEENNDLKIYINQTEQDINLLKNEVKNLLDIKNKHEEEKQIEKNIINEKSDELFDLLKKYSDEILYLKEQNKKLINSLNNNDKNINEISNENTMKIKLEYQTEISKFEKYINDFAKEINEELFVISQWIETYLGKDYDKGYEIPPLINELENKDCNCKINLINFHLIKSALEKSTVNLNSIINSKETEIIKLNNIIQEKENKYNEIKKELIKAKNKHLELCSENDKLRIEKESDMKLVLNHKNIINNLKQKDENSQLNNFNYLKDLYKIIQHELNLILSDVNFKVYHQKIFNLKEKDNDNDSLYQNNINLIEDKLNNLIMKFIEFVEELKYDYIQIKKENMNILLSKTNINKELLMKNNNDDLINTYKRKIAELTNNNNFLNEQMKIMSRNNELNSLNDDLSRYSNMREENKELKFNNDNLMNKIKEMNDNYLEIAKQNNKLKEKINELKLMENNDMNLKNKFNELSKDYQRILKENDSLKIFINSQN